MRLVFRVHAVRRMFERGVSVDDVRAVLEGGEVVEEYPQDKPFPSRLVLGWRGTRPVHVVATDDEEGGVTYVVTVYEPGGDLWGPGFRERKRS